MRSIIKKGTILGTIVGAALLTAAPFSLQWSQKTVALSLDSADARIGRPLTPLSVAGVHRRAYRRAVYGAAAYGVGRITGPPAIQATATAATAIRLMAMGLTPPAMAMGLTPPAMAMGLTPPAIQAMAIGRFTPSPAILAMAMVAGPPAEWRSIAPAGTEARATRIKRPWAGVPPARTPGEVAPPPPGGHGRRPERVSGGRQPRTREKAEKPPFAPRISKDAVSYHPLAYRGLRLLRKPTTNAPSPV